MAALRLTSPAFDEDRQVPLRHTGAGEDVSPPLAWTGVPEGTRELALVCDDPDSDEGDFTHWVVYGIPPDATGLPERVPHAAIVDGPVECVQGLNDWDEVGYQGPEVDEERGPHRLFFRLFALGEELDLPPGASRAELRRAAKGHVIAAAELVGIV